MPAIGLVKYPKKRIDFLSDRTTARGLVEISTSQLGLAERVEIAVGPVVFENVDDLSA